MKTAEPSELGHANTALLLGLFDVLATKGILTRSDLNTVITDAISKIEASRHISRKPTLSNSSNLSFLTYTAQINRHECDQAGRSKHWIKVNGLSSPKLEPQVVGIA
jgi:hypothetical protein